MFTYVYPCLLVFTYVYNCLHQFYLFSTVYSCLLMFTRVYLFSRVKGKGFSASMED